jgi:hypothetical protein
MGSVSGWPGYGSDFAVRKAVQVAGGRIYGPLLAFLVKLVLQMGFFVYEESVTSVVCRLGLTACQVFHPKSAQSVTSERANYDASR